MYSQQSIKDAMVQKMNDNNINFDESGNCCSICQRSAHDYFHHWACFKFFTICNGCYTSMRLAQCTICKGVGAANDITVQRDFSASARTCPSCREKVTSLKKVPIAV
jgi:hypothetical protein